MPDRCVTTTHPALIDVSGSSKFNLPKLYINATQKPEFHQYMCVIKRFRYALRINQASHLIYTTEYTYKFDTAKYMQFPGSALSRTSQSWFPLQSTSISMELDQRTSKSQLSPRLYDCTKSLVNDRDLIKLAQKKCAPKTVGFSATTSRT